MCAACVLLFGVRGRLSWSERNAPFTNGRDRPRDNRSWLWLDVDSEASAGTLEFSQPRQANCTLWFLRDVLHAFSYVPGDSIMLLRHWLTHYLDGLGLRSDHVHFAINADLAVPNLDASIRVLELAGVARNQVTLVNGSYSDLGKLARVNDFIQGLPTDAWFIFADHDEFFSFSCAMPSLVKSYDRFCAQMMDRLAADGTIAPLQNFPDISVQYPIACGLRQMLSAGSRVGTGQFMTSKTAPSVFGNAERSERFANHTGTF